MSTTTAHPKRAERCAFCKRWDGNANLVFKSPATGFQFDVVSGKCMLNNSIRSSAYGSGCRNYEPNAEANRVL